MGRKFVPFDAETINKELLRLPSEDFLRLTLAMKLFQTDADIGFRHKVYGDGIEMITDSGTGAGRCLFFFRDADAMVVLTVYKKESQSVPSRLLKLAQERKKRYEQDRES